MSTLYKVMALTGYRGHKQGDEFEADLTPDEERRAKQRGSIRVVRRDTNEHEQKEEGNA